MKAATVLCCTDTVTAMVPHLRCHRKNRSRTVFTPGHYQLPACMHPAIGSFERKRVQLSTSKLKSNIFASPPCTSCKLDHCFYTSILKLAVQLLLKRSPRHAISSTAPSHSPLFERLQIQFPPASFQLFLPFSYLSS